MRTPLPPSVPASTELSLTGFQAVRGEAFAAAGGSGELPPLRLVGVASLGFNTPAERGGRESFSLEFLAPSGGRWPQGNYRLTHPRLGGHVIFLVPLGPDRDGMRLEAVFNFL